MSSAGQQQQVQEQQPQEQQHHHHHKRHSHHSHHHHHHHSHHHHQKHRQKKLSHQHPPHQQPQGVPSPSRVKRLSTPVIVGAYGHGEEDEAVADVTRSLESAVRKISRGSSPNPPPKTAAPIAGGLSGLARGYEQYRESLNLFRLPAGAEFGEASSDDLSSEWESSDVESNNNNSIGRPMTPVPMSATAAASSKEEEEETAAAPASTAKEPAVSSPPPTKKFPLPLPAPQPDKPKYNRPSGWKKLRSIVQWTPFIQRYKDRKYRWVQLAGHSGNFKAGRSQGTVLKKLCPQEEQCYLKFAAGDSLEDFVPKFQGTLEVEDEETKSTQKFIQLQDCLSSFSNPSIMDCKIGVRTYLEEELAKAKEKVKLRKDMYDKMVAVDPAAPSPKEHEWKGVTKPRYMVWRETISSTATLGFRIEGVKNNRDGTSSKEFKTTKEREDILRAFSNFLANSSATAKQYLDRLVKIRQALGTSEFFKSHELIGSSLLFVHDAQKASVWLIDFGKTVPVPDGLSIDHRSPWEVGNHEDGYLIGVENLIELFSCLAAEEEEANNNNNSEAATASASSASSTPSPSPPTSLSPPSFPSSSSS